LQLSPQLPLGWHRNKQVEVYGCLNCETAQPAVMAAKRLLMTRFGNQGYWLGAMALWQTLFTNKLARITHEHSAHLAEHLFPPSICHFVWAADLRASDTPVF
jgi:hypothetical protein